MANIGQYSKSLIAAVIAGLTTYQTALLDGTVNQNEWISIAVATVLALGAVFTVSNDKNGNGIPDDQEKESGVVQSTEGAAPSVAEPERVADAPVENPHLV